MFVDASALAAILKNEPERRQILSTIGTTPGCMTSPVSVFETSIAVAPLTGSCSSALSEVSRLLHHAGVTVASLEASMLLEMAIAHDRYGKGSGQHPARLNLGDCVSYAMAKGAGLPLLYKGDDFARTDMA